jgi:hypothetical protein
MFLAREAGVSIKPGVGFAQKFFLANPGRATTNNFLCKGAARAKMICQRPVEATRTNLIALKSSVTTLA